MSTSNCNTASDKVSPSSSVTYVAEEDADCMSVVSEGVDDGKDFKLKPFTIDECPDDNNVEIVDKQVIGPFVKDLNTYTSSNTNIYLNKIESSTNLHILQPKLVINYFTRNGPRGLFNLFYLRRILVKIN